MQFRNLDVQYQALRPAIDDAIAGILARSRFIGGNLVSELESELAKYVGVKHCVTCGNGTDALMLALMAWHVGAGDAVFVLDFTFFASGEAPALLDATPVFVDAGERAHNMSAASLEAAVKNVVNDTDLKPRVVVAVDLSGQTADFYAVREICAKYGMPLLEDAAQGFGGMLVAKHACLFGDISCTSFFPAKPLGRYGDGSAVFTDDDERVVLVRSYAVHDRGSTKCDKVRLGMNSRLDSLQASILLVKLAAFRKYEVDNVNQVANWYIEVLQNTDLILPVVPEGHLSSWAQYTVQPSEGTDREALQAVLRGRDIPTMVYYPKPMHEQLVFSGDGVDTCACICFDGCPTAKRLYNTVLSLPIGLYATEIDVHTVATALGSLCTIK